jgi:transcriptional regulator with XRE-family HTH domain
MSVDAMGKTIAPFDSGAIVDAKVGSTFDCGGGSANGCATGGDRGAPRRVIAADPVGSAGYTGAVEENAPDAGMARAGAAAAARRTQLGVSQRELARRKVISAANLIAFEKGRAWPRERTRHTLEQLLQWPAGTIAAIRAGASSPDPAAAQSSSRGDTSLLEETLQMTLARFDDAIEQLPQPVDVAYAPRANTILVDLHRFEQLAARAVRHSQGSPTVLKALSMVRRRYDELMLQAAASPGATLGQRLYASRRRAELSAAEAAAAVGATTELIEALEAGEPVDDVTAARVEDFITQWSE